jgi:hypothetical protein
MPTHSCGAEIVSPSSSMVPRVGLIEAGGEPQQRALAATRPADDGDDLALLDFELHAVERAHAVRISLYRPIEC